MNVAELLKNIAAATSILGGVGVLGGLYFQRIQIRKLAEELRTLRQEKALQIEKLSLEVESLRRQAEREASQPSGRIYVPTPEEVDRILAMAKPLHKQSGHAAGIGYHPLMWPLFTPVVAFLMRVEGASVRTTTLVSSVYFIWSLQEARKLNADTIRELRRVCSELRNLPS